jgi:HNH endonuclease
MTPPPYPSDIKDIEKACLFCGKSFLASRKHSGQKYCGNECKMAAVNRNRREGPKVRLQKTCAVCARPFEVPPCFDYVRSCSRECGAVLRRKTITKACPICEKQFSVTPSTDKKTCSQRCGAYLRSGEGHHRWTKDRLKACLQCGKQYDGASGWRKTKRFCGRHCYFLFSQKHGRSSAVPIGTITQDPYGYRRIKVSIRKWKSEHVWVVEVALGRTLTRAEVVHHRNGNPSDNRLDNLQVVSRQQHMRIHHEAEKVGLRVMCGELIVVESTIHSLEGCEV